MSPADEVTKILIADDHEIMRRGLSLVLEAENEFSLVGEACDGEEACEMAIRLKPDVILMDVRMPRKDGICASKEIKQLQPSTKIIILTAVEDDGEIFDALNCGVDGYVLKDIGSTGLMEAIRTVRSGVSFLHPQVAKRVMARLSRKPGQGKGKPDHDLTDREKVVLKLMAEGMRNREIAAKLFIGEETVKSHVSNILRKLDQEDRMRAVLYAIRERIVTP